MAELIQKQDTLNKGRVKLNNAITDAEAAKADAGSAKEKSEQALAQSESTQTQLDTIVIEGDSSVEAAQARVPVEGAAYETLKDRLDSEYTDVTTQLTHTTNHVESMVINVKYPPKPLVGVKMDGVSDDSKALQDIIDYAQQNGNSGQYPDKRYGYRIEIPTGVLILRDKIRVTGSGIQIAGSGRQSTIINYKGDLLSSNEYLFTIDGGDDELIVGFTLKDVTIRGDDLGDEGQVHPRAIRVNRTNDWEIENINVFYLHQPLHTSNAWVGTLSKSSFKHNYRGAYLDGQSHNVSVRDVVFGSGVLGFGDISHQLAIRNSWSISIDNCDFEFGNHNNLVTSIYMYNQVRGVSVTNCYFESNTGYAVYIRDEIASNSGGCDGIEIKGNFINQGEGKGVYIRHNNESGRLHEGIEISGNYVYITPSLYFVEESAKNRPLVNHSSVKNNAITQGFGEYAYSSATGWNKNEIGSIKANQTNNYLPTMGVKENDLVVSTFNNVSLPYQSLPLTLSTNKSLREGHVYLVTVLLKESSTVEHTSIHIVNTRDGVRDLIPLVSGSLSIDGSKLKYEKTSGFSCGVEINVIPIG